jgi:hypothetical protein
VWHKINSNLLESLPWSCPDTFVMEGIALMKSTQLVKSGGIFITKHLDSIVVVVVVKVDDNQS